MLHFRTKIALVIILFSVLAIGQEPTDFRREMEPEVPTFIYDITETPLETRDSIAVDIVIQVPFNAIQFVKKDSVFIGKYEISVMLLDEKEVNVISKIWTQTLRTVNFAETYSAELFDINRLSYKIVPSKYSVSIGILDLDTRKSTYRKKAIDVKDFYNKSITLSNINLIEGSVTDSVGHSSDVSSITGKLSDNRNEFEISFYVLSEGGTGTIKYTIYNMNKKIVLDEKLERIFRKGVDYQKIKVPRTNLSFNKYRMVVKVSIGSEEATAEKIIQIRWAGMSNMIDNLDGAVEQLKYIASMSVIKKMRKADQEEKKRLFLEFWEKKDPTPGTQENELMNEYYRRVNFSNQNFSGYLEGWKSDMGMVYILFGPPSDIERHPFELQTKPYEVWYYYELNRTFIFVDESGFGEYRLITPFDYYGSIY